LLWGNELVGETQRVLIPDSALEYHFCITFT
jgi:hypothetical protein